MAVDVCCSEASGSEISPRISFSYDLDSMEDNEIRLDSTLLDAGSEFDFCFGSSCSVHEVSPADELFSDGKILPAQIKKEDSSPQTVTFRVQRSASLSSSSSSSSSSSLNASEKKIIRLKEILSDPEPDLENKPRGLFLQFKRSISLNYDKSRNSRSLIRSFHFLSRSNSTGSAPDPKLNFLPKETHNPQKTHNLPKHTSPLRRSSSLSASSVSYYSKPRGRKSFGNGNGGIRVSPVLNFPPPTFISNVAGGFCSIGSLCNGKTNRKTKV